MLRTLIVVCIAIIGACRSTTKQPEPAQSATSEPPAARQFASWLVAFNSMQRGPIDEFRKAHFADDVPDWPAADAEHGFSLQTGGFVVVKTEQSSPTAYAVIVKERASDQHARAVMEVDPAPPHRIRRLDVKAIPTPDDMLAPRRDDAEVLASLRAELDKRAAADDFSGAVLIAKDGTPLFTQAYGFADRDAKVPNAVTTRFRIGSMNKMFTSVALLQLVQADRVKLDAPIGTYLPSYPNKNVASKVTAHHLLSHTGGTGDIFGPEFEKKRLELRTHADYVALYGSRDVEFEPGVAFAYSNYGFILAGAIIESVTGKTYYDALASNVYAPAGMTSTSSPPEERGEPGRSIAYTREQPDAAWASAAATLPWRGTAAGGGDSTVGDLLAFANALTAHKLLDAKHLQLATTTKPSNVDAAYGYGFGIETFGSTRCVGHGGGAPGMNGQLYICDSGYTIAVLANLDPPAANQIAQSAALQLRAK